MGGVMVYLTKQWIYSLFMLMGPVMVLGHWLSGRKPRGGSHRRKMRAYTAQMAEVEAKLEQTKAAGIASGVARRSKTEEAAV